MARTVRHSMTRTSDARPSRRRLITSPVRFDPCPAKRNTDVRAAAARALVSISRASSQKRRPSRMTRIPSLPEPLSSLVLKFVTAFNKAARELLISQGMGERDSNLKTRSQIVPFVFKEEGDPNVSLVSADKIPLTSILNGMKDIDADALLNVDASESNYIGIYIIKRFRAKHHAGHDLTPVFHKVTFGNQDVALTKSGKRRLYKPLV